VTCENEEIARISGREMLTGSEATEGYAEGPEVLAIAAFAVGLAGGVLYFMSGKKGCAVRGALGVLGILLPFALVAKTNNKLEDEGEGMLQASYLPGFWLTVLSFLAAAVANFLDFVGFGSDKNKKGE